MNERRTQPQRKKGNAKRALLIALCVFLAVVLVVLIVVTASIEKILGMMNKVDEIPQDTMSAEEYQQMLDGMKETVAEDYTGEVLHEDDVEWGSDEGLIEEGDDIINVLLIGQDRRSNQGRSRSDVIILCTVNIPQKTLTFTSFMRDMYVQIPGYDDNRINVPYVLGGMELLDNTLKRNFGVEVDGNVEVDFQGFIGVIDLMGGIEMYIRQDEADYMNMNVSWDVEDGTDKQWNITEGVNHLTGSQALSYARMRYVGNADYERTERQRKVLSALVEKAKELSISELNVLMQHALPMLTTDMENSQIVGYALKVFPILPELEVKTLRIPVDGGYQSTYVREMAVLLPNLQKNRDALEEVILGTD